MKQQLLFIFTFSIVPTYGQTEKEKEAIKEMVEWIESPREFNESPKTISIRDSRKLFWPSKELIDAYLIDFTDSKGGNYVGLLGQ